MIKVQRLPGTQPKYTLQRFINILKPSSNRSPYIFTLVQNVKHRVYKIRAFLNEAILWPRLCKLFHLKMTCTSCTDEVREKVPSFQKVTLFLRYKPKHRALINLCFCLFEAVTGYHNIRRINLKRFVSIGLVVFATQQHKTNTFSKIIIEIQL